MDNRRRRALLWFAFLGGAGAWSAHLLLAYLIAEFACVAGVDQHVWLGVMAPAWWLIGVSAAMLIVAVAAALVGRSGNARLERPVHPPSDRSLVTDAYMAKTGYAMSAMFGFIIIVQSVPIFFYLQSC